MGISKKEERLGYQGRTRIGELFTVVEYNNTNSVVIEFENGDRKHTYWKSVVGGNIAHHPNEWKKIDRAGEEMINRYGEHCRITKYIRYEEVEVTFDDGGTTMCSYCSFKNGQARNPNHGYTRTDLATLGLDHCNMQPQFKNREGERRTNSNGHEMVVIEYINANKMLVEFTETGCQVWASWDKFAQGAVKDPMAKDIYNAACFGVGPYDSKHPAYKKWFQMIRRCYDLKWKAEHNYYDDVSVCEEWLNYQNFAQWYAAQPPYDPEYHLDKDLINREARMYSPETCSWLPRELNSMITKNEAIRGTYPIGVSEIPHMPGKYLARLTDNYRVTGKTYLLHQIFDTPEEAFAAYKLEKEKFVKQQAEVYKDKLATRTYEALLRWTVSITD